MSPNKKFREERSRFHHVSAPIIANPAYHIELAMRQIMSPEQVSERGAMPPVDIVGPRVTYFKRRNESKRMRVSTCRHEGTKAFRLAEPLVRCAKKVTP